MQALWNNTVLAKSDDTASMEGHCSFPVRGLVPYTSMAKVP